MIRYSLSALSATPITAPGYKAVSFVFHPDGTDIDMLPSALFTSTLPDDWLVVDVLLVVDDVIAVDVLLAVDDDLTVDDLLQPESWSMIEEIPQALK